MVFDGCCIKSEVILSVLKMNQPSLLQNLHIEQTDAEVAKETGDNAVELLLKDNRYVSHEVIA